MKTRNTRKGFTTVELVIVIAVIAILATVLIPTFSNMIEKANLSVDKQNVRNMNVCLATYSITDGNPSDFGKVKEELKEYGYGTNDNFIPKSKGYSIRWYTDDRDTPDRADDISVILLLDADNNVVYPEEYVGNDTIQTRNKYMCFDLSLPAAVVEDHGRPSEAIDVEMYFDTDITVSANQAVSYTFTANELPSKKYDGWYADFYVTYLVPDSATQHNVMIAGQYNVYDKDSGSILKEIPWTGIEAPVAESIVGLPLLQTLLEMDEQFTYEMIRTEVKMFHCGIVDTGAGPDGVYPGASWRVELRLTNPENAEDFEVIGVYNYPEN